MQSHSKKIIFFVPYPPAEAPSQRFRFEQYAQHLTSQGFKITVISFYSQFLWGTLYKEGNSFRKLMLFSKAYFLHYFKVFKAIGNDYVFIHREILPIGPPIPEWIISKLFRKKIIYDFDDAIWKTDLTHESFIQRVLKCRWKVALICKWSYKVSCGNDYLCEYALKFNSAVVLNPTTIDTLNLHRANDHHKKENTNETVIGWTGSHSTLKYLLLIDDVVSELQQKYPFLKLIVIANKAPQLASASFEFIPWTKESEMEDLQQIDIGIMPLPDDDWSKGKCGFKALQYMALEIPPVVSAVGVNTKIVSDNVDGFVCASKCDWITALETLINNKDKRKSMGSKARTKVENQFSVSSNASNFLSLFQ